MEQDTYRPRRASYAGLTSSSREATRRIPYGGPNLASVPYDQESGFPSPSLRRDDDATGAAFPFPDMMNNLEAQGTNRIDPLNRNRRMSRVAEEELTCSQQSILSDIERFVRAVSNMDSTVLVPSRLQDIDSSTKGKNLPPTLPLENTDFVSFFTLVKDVRNELLWGSLANTSLAQVSNGQSRHPKNVRQPSSDEGLGSTESDQEMDSDLESITTERDTNEEASSSHLALSFRHHLQALQAIMHQLTESANFLSTKYQESIDSLQP